MPEANAPNSHLIQAERQTEQSALKPGDAEHKATILPNLWRRQGEWGSQTLIQYTSVALAHVLGCLLSADSTLRPGI